MVEDIPEVSQGLNFTLDLLFLPSVQEVAPASITAISISEVCHTLLCLVFRISRVVLPELVGSMSKLALVVVGAVAKLREFPTQL